MNLEKEDIQQLKAGDEKIYRDIFNAFYAPLCQYALIYLNQTSIAEEVVHNLFIKLWENKADLEIRTSFKSYLFRSVRNQCLNHLRNQKSRAISVDSLEEVEDELLEEISIYEEMDMPELKATIKSAIDDLPPKCRQIFLMSRESELTYTQIAEELSVSKKTVENQMGIALKRLKEKLSPSLFLFIWYLY